MARKPKHTASAPAPRSEEPAPIGAAEDSRVLDSAPVQDDGSPGAEAPAWPLWLTVGAAALLGAAQVLAAPAPRVATLASAAGLLAAVAVLIAFGSALLGAANPQRRPMAVGGLAGATLGALLSVRLHELASPALAAGWAEPLRDAVMGLTPPFGAALAASGLLALAQLPASRAARALAGLGALHLWLHAFLPVGWLGSTVIPAFAALTGIANPAAPATDLPLAGANFLLIEAFLSMAALVVVLRPSLLPRAALLGLVAGLVALCVAWPLHAGASAIALQTLASMALSAGGLLLALHWCGEDTLPALARSGEAVAIALITATYLILKVNGLRYSTTDEGLYFYAAKLWSQGQVPYRDFFFSHPPLHIGIPALAYAVFGYHFVIGKLLSAGAALVAGLAAWRIARAHIGVVAGVLTLGLYLTACEVLQASTNLTGINLTAAWMLLGLWATLSRRFFWGGLLLGAAASTGFYSLGTFLALAVLAALQPMPAPIAAGEPTWRRLSRHPAAHIVLGFLCVWGTLNLYFTLVAGDAYLGGVYAYHLAKKAKVAGYVPLSEGPQAVVANFMTLLESRDFTVTLYYHSPHYFLALLAPIGVALRVWLRGLLPQVTPSADKKRKAEQASGADWALLYDPRRWWRDATQGGTTMIVWVVTGALLVEFGQFKERYDFYYALLIPGLAIGAAAWLSAVLELGLAAVHAATAAARTWRPPQAVLWVTLAAVATSLLWVPINLSANRKAYASEFNVVDGSGGLGEKLTFEWLDPPGPALVGELTRALFWQDTRLRGNIETGIHHYLWNKKRWFSKAEEIAAYIKAHSAAEDTITGASDYAPLLALLADRRLAGNQVDTNSKVFNTGAVPLETFWDKVCADHVKFLVVAPMSYFAAQSIQKRTTIIENFRPEKSFSDLSLRHWKSTDIELWVRKQEPPAKACEFKGARGAGPSLDRD